MTEFGGLRGSGKTGFTTEYIMQRHFLILWVRTDTEGFESRDRALLHDYSAMAVNAWPVNSVVQDYARLSDGTPLLVGSGTLLFGYRLPETEDSPK